MSDPFTFEKNFRMCIDLKFVSQHSLVAVTPETVMRQIKQRLEHSDTLMDVVVRRVAEYPDRLQLLTMRLQELQTVMEAIKQELKNEDP